MTNDKYRQQTSLSFSPELVSLLDDLRDETGINRSKLAEHMMWYAVQHGVLDEMGGGYPCRSVRFKTGAVITA